MKIDFTSVEHLHTYINDHVPGAFSIFDMKTLVSEIKKLEPGETYLEVGVDQGRSFATAYFTAKEGVNLYGVDINNPPMREQVWKEQGFPVTAFTHGKSEEVAKTWKIKPIKILFIDADHSYDGCKTDIESWLPFMDREGVILFHDYDISSPGVMKAVDEFINSDQVKESINLRAEDPEFRSSIVKVILK